MLKNEFSLPLPSPPDGRLTCWWAPGFAYQGASEDVPFSQQASDTLAINYFGVRFVSPHHITPRRWLTAGS